MRLQASGLVVAALVVLAQATLISPASASTFARRHPRRAEVNRRLTNQHARVNQGVRSGALTGAQAVQLKANDKAIKQQERTDVKTNGGYLTKTQKQQLNQEENADSKLIRDEKHPK